MHDKTIKPAACGAPHEDEAVRLVSRLLVVARDLAEGFVRDGQAVGADDETAFARSYDDLMAVARIVGDAAGHR